MNGEVAFVLAWDDEEGEARLSLDEGEREIVVPAAALETYVLAWALTVHRAQGSQFPAVVAPWPMADAGMLSRPLLYPAVTRAERLCVIVRERRALAAAGGRAERRPPHPAHAAVLAHHRPPPRAEHTSSRTHSHRTPAFFAAGRNRYPQHTQGCTPPMAVSSRAPGRRLRARARTSRRTCRGRNGPGT